MRSFSALGKGFNDENLKIKSKGSGTGRTNYSHFAIANGTDRREVLGDVTQRNENRKSDSNFKTSILRIQLYKHKQLQQQKQQLERLDKKAKYGAKGRESTNNSDEQRLLEQLSEKSDTNTNEYKDWYALYDSDLEQLDVDKENLSPEIQNKSTTHARREYEEEIEQKEEKEEEEELEETEESCNNPMDPKWNREIFNELQYVMKKYSRKTLDEEDEDTYDITMVAEYAPEIFNYMHALEYKFVPDPYYMKHQVELKWKMRSVLIDWVVQVHGRFNLLPETLFLTVNYIDRFLSRRKVSLSRFQLVGAVALFIAAKYEEINCPTIQEVAYMADNAYSIEDFMKAERFMIDVLEFDLGWPGPMSFLRRTSKADDYDYETRTLAKYFLEITIMEPRFVAAQPSWLAAGAHYLARKLLNRGFWTEAHVFYSGYTEVQLRPLAEVLLQSCRNPTAHHKAIFEKYEERRFRRSSTFVQEYFRALEKLE